MSTAQHVNGINGVICTGYQPCQQCQQHNMSTVSSAQDVNRFNIVKVLTQC